ncbi:MAG: NAD(P)-dependent oxidoreductase [candidate division Zixibacteria bacterium]|nr:NAD(P)-dependent oxidoreductase [candidate division Zixibacteria bacterium]
MKKVLLIGASGLIAPHIIPSLEPHCDLYLADIKPHPEGRPVQRVDVTDYAQVRHAADGMDAILNFTVNRPHPAHTFHVNTLGAFHVMKAAAEAGVRKVIHTGPAMVLGWYDHDFDVAEAPHAPSTYYYFLTKHLSYRLVESFARTYRIPTLCYLFTQLRHRPAPTESMLSAHPFTIFFNDLADACRQGIELSEVPGYYQEFNLHSLDGQDRYTLEKAKRLLGYAPRTPIREYFGRENTNS